MNQGQEFLVRPEVETTIKEFAQACFDRIEAGEEATLPDPAAFFAERGIEVPSGISLKVNHETRDDRAIVEWVDCGGGVKSRPEAKVINGKIQIIYVCP